MSCRGRGLYGVGEGCHVAEGELDVGEVEHDVGDIYVKGDTKYGKHVGCLQKLAKTR